MKKRCSKCNILKDLNEFNKNNGSKDKHYIYCKSCSNKISNLYYKKNSKRAKKYSNDRYYKNKDYNMNEHLKTKFGITLEEYNKMVEQQNNKCEICGKEAHLIIARIEGSELRVCSTCGKHGKIVHRPIEKIRRPTQEKPEIIELVVSDCADLIRKARKKLDMTQKAFANLLKERESIIQKLEGGSFTPPISMAKKLEKLLRIKLIELEEASSAPSQKTSTGSLTIGDILKIKK